MSRAGFLQAIAAEPDDDAHRLVYADWLDDHGDTEDQGRAALIRCQCAAEVLPPGKERRSLEKQAKAIIAAHPQWTKPITKARLGADLRFRRGFLHQVTLPAVRFVKVAAKLFAAAPLVRSIIFPTPLDEIADLLACPDVARLTEADLSQYCACGSCGIDEQILAVFAAPLLANLTRLRVAGNRIDAAGAAVIAAATNLPRLRELSLTKNELGNAGAKALLESPWLGQLQRLDVSENDIGPQALKALRKKYGKVLAA